MTADARAVPKKAEKRTEAREKKSEGEQKSFF